MAEGRDGVPGPDLTFHAVGTAPDPWGRGIVAAAIVTDGRTLTGLGNWHERVWTRAELSALAGPDPAATAELVETAHAELLGRFPEAEVIGFSGLPLPLGDRRATAVGDGAVLAGVLDRPVVWDFDTAVLLMGGEPAPLTGPYHHALIRYLGATRPAAVLSLDGIPRLTWADPRRADPVAPGVCLAFDTGPALPVPDMAGGQGEVSVPICNQAMADAFLHRLPPRLLRPGDFPRLHADLADLSPLDARATLYAVIRESLKRGLAFCPQTPDGIFITGAAAHQPRLMQMLDAGTGRNMQSIAAGGEFDGTEIAAQAVAFNAVRVLCGLPTSCPGTSGLPVSVGGGEISQPGAD